MKRIVGLNRFGYLKRGRMGDAEKSSLTAGCSRKGNVMFQTTHNLDNQECQKRWEKSLNPVVPVAAESFILHLIHAQPVRRISF